MIEELERPVYVKDAPPRVFDVHVHFPFHGREPNRGPLGTPDAKVDALVYNCQRLNIYKVALLGAPDDNDGVERAFNRYPDLFLPMARIDVDTEQPERIGEYARRGFRGLKIINPRRDYDHPAYYPLYEQAEKHNLVCLFHTGIVGGPIDFLQFPPSSHEAGAQLSREGEQRRRFNPEAGEVDSWYGAGRMQPIYLDGVSVAFPELQVIGAHLGYGLYDSAAAVARWRRNVSFDISGGVVVRRHLVTRGMIRAEVSTKKLAWGSDCDISHMSRELTSWMQAFAEIGLSAEEQDDIFWGTAARIFGIKS